MITDSPVLSNQLPLHMHLRELEEEKGCVGRIKEGREEEGGEGREKGGGKKQSKKMEHEALT